MISISAPTIRLKHDLNIIEGWAYQWKMVFIPDPENPANEVVFSNRSHINPQPLVFANKIIKVVKSHKHSGIILDSILDFNAHLKRKIG